MMPAAKHFDPVIGVDIHIIQPPGPVPPIPVPHPFIGFIIDPFDYAPYIGSTVKINYMHRAQAGTAGKCVPSHIPIGGVFVKPPANECEMFMGSATVCIDGDAQSYLSLPALSCHDVGMIAPPRVNPKKKSKIKSMVLPTSLVLPIPAGPPVLIGGPPTISLMALGMRVGMAALGKAFKRLAKTKKFRRLKAKVKSKFKRKRKPSHHKSCGRPGEPIDVSNGANVDDFLDYEVAGPIPFEWKRFYDSSLCDHESPMGRGFRHFYQRELKWTSAGFELVTAEGEVVEFDPLTPEAACVANDGLALSRGKDGVYRIAESGYPTMEFRFERGKKVAPLRALTTAKHRLDLHYDSDEQLESIRGSQGEYIRFKHDDANHICELTMTVGAEAPRVIASYDYDSEGHLRSWTDANGCSSYYFYDANGRMRKKTDRNGYSYRYRYDELGRCVHTWGDDGLYDIRFEYFPEAMLTIATYGDGAIYTYLFNEHGTLIEIVDPAGGSTKFVTNEVGDVVAEVDPAGDKTTFLYDEWGGHTGRIAPTGHPLPPMHVQPQQPDVLAYELPRTPVEWELGAWLAGQISPSNGDDPVLQKFPVPITRADLAATDLVGSPTRAKELVDAQGRLVERTDELGRRERWQYDRNGNLVAYHDPDGAIQGRRIESWNLIRQTIDPLGNATTFDYSLREQITRVVDAGGTASEFQVDGCDRLVEVRRHGKVRERYEYDQGGNLARKLDGNGKTLFEAKPAVFGLPAEYVLATGDKQTFAYDPSGRLIAAKSKTSDLKFKYDWSGRVASDLRNQLGIEHEVAPTQARTTKVLKNFQIRQRFVQPGECEVVDPTGAIHRFRLSKNGTVSRQLSNGTWEVSQFDKDGNCHGKLSLNPSRPESRWSRRYHYSAAGDLLEVEDSQLGPRRFQYDAAHRLVAETRANGETSHFIHDRANNLIAQPGLGAVELQSGNRLKSANGWQFDYNDRDHLARRTHPSEADIEYVYDPLDMLVRVTRGDWQWQAEYDPIGRRISKSWNDRRVDFYWDDDRLAAEVHDKKLVRIYVYANAAAWVPFMFVDFDGLDADPESGRRYFVFTDQIGTPVRIEDDFGETVWNAIVSPYGNVEIAPGAKIEFSLRFPGHYHDAETGLFYNRFRYYDPTLGRYLQSDPLGIAGGINVYAYPSNPLTNVDLQGLHGKAHSKGKGNRKGGPKAESTSMRGAGAPRPDPKKLAGMTDEAFAATCRIANKHQVKIRVRPSNPDCLDWIKKGHPKKPEFIKNKTINELDELMGPPPAPGNKGLVGHFEPPPRDAAVARAEEKLGRPLTDAEKEALEQRRAERLAEYHRNDAELRHEKGDKVTVDDSRGVLVDNRPGSTQGKEFTGDHDMFDIQQKGSDGQWHPADQKTKDAVVDDMKNDPNVQAQHGDHKSWEYDPNDKQAKDIDKAVLEGHQEGKKPLVDFNPDGSVGTSHYDGPVPD